MAARFEVSVRVLRKLRRRYERGESIRQLAVSLGGNIKQETVARLFRRHGIPIVTKAERRYAPEVEQKIVTAYCEKGVGMPELVRRYGGFDHTINNVLLRYHVLIRHQGAQEKEFEKKEFRQIVALRNQGWSQVRIANELHLSQIRVSRTLRKNGIVSLDKASGEKHGAWKGGRIVLGGYYAAKVSHDSPYLDMALKSGYILEHRYVMAQKLGRCLTKNETVHHINGDKTDNRPENLQLRHGKHGRGKVLMCADCGSHNIVPAPLASVSLD